MSDPSLQEHDRLAGPTRRVATHPGCVPRHTGKGESDGVGAVRDEPVDRFRRYVSLDRISVDHRGVARLCTIGDAHGSPVCRSIGIFGHVDGGALRSQVHDPRRATASTRIASDLQRQAVEHAGHRRSGRSRHTAAVATRASGGEHARETDEARPEPGQEASPSDGCHQG